MNPSLDTTSASRAKLGHITRRVAAWLASAFITFTLFHEVAMLGAPQQGAAAAPLAQSPAPLALARRSA